MDDRTVLFVMTNPSVATEERNDNTIRRDIDFANRWGFGWLVVCNAFAYRATDPEELSKVDDPCGPENDAHILREAQAANLVVVAWGEPGAYLGRSGALCTLLTGITLYCLGINASGQPKHPLYVPKTQALTVWSNGHA